MDYGNSSHTGQVILSTPHSLQQPDGGCGSLPTVFDFFPNMASTEDVNEPSCSLAEAVESQDLFVNQMLATYGLDLLWKLFRYGRIENHGVFVDLENYKTTPVSVQSSYDRFVAN